ncbi:MAG: GPR endopeptidase [Clostridia bacterium]|nr:GPR endopeptidase [Clostridia bacterium]
MKRSSDLALENFGSAAAESAFRHEKIHRRGFAVLRVQNTDGAYRTILSGRIWQSSQQERRELVLLASELLRELLPSAVSRVLIAGIGNPDIACDALGPRFCRRILVTGEDSGIGVHTFVCTPSVPARTGFDTALLLRSLADGLHPDAMIACDSLAAASREHLSTVIQIGTGGISPGSAMTHTTGEISSRTMPCPVVTIGVPAAVSTEVLTGEDESEPLLVTCADSDVITDCYASILAGAVNACLFGK